MKEQTTPLGEYPTISLKAARERVYSMKNEIFQGINPKKETKKKIFTFCKVAQ